MNRHSFLGTGWAFHPEFHAGGAQVQMVSDAEDIEKSLEVILGTAPGERLMHREFGCDLNKFVFEEVDRHLINGLTETISDAILQQEPRIHLDNVQISESQATVGLLLISIQYTVRGTNSRYNMVYPFYINESS